MIYLSLQKTLSKKSIVRNTYYLWSMLIILQVCTGNLYGAKQKSHVHVLNESKKDDFKKNKHMIYQLLLQLNRTRQENNQIQLPEHVFPQIIDYLPRPKRHIDVWLSYLARKKINSKINIHNHISSDDTCAGKYGDVWSIKSNKRTFTKRFRQASSLHTLSPSGNYVLTYKDTLWLGPGVSISEAPTWTARCIHDDETKISEILGKKHIFFNNDDSQIILVEKNDTADHVDGFSCCAYNNHKVLDRRYDIFKDILSHDDEDIKQVNIDTLNGKFNTSNTCAFVSYNYVSRDNTQRDDHIYTLVYQINPDKSWNRVLADHINPGDTMQIDVTGSCALLMNKREAKTISTNGWDVLQKFNFREPKLVSGYITSNGANVFLEKISKKLQRYNGITGEKIEKYTNMRAYKVPYDVKRKEYLIGLRNDGYLFLHQFTKDLPIYTQTRNPVSLKADTNLDVFPQNDICICQITSTNATITYIINNALVSTNEFPEYKLLLTSLDDNTIVELPRFTQELSPSYTTNQIFECNKVYHDSNKFKISTNPMQNAFWVLLNSEQRSLLQKLYSSSVKRQELRLSTEQTETFKSLPKPLRSELKSHMRIKTSTKISKAFNIFKKHA